MEELTIKTPDLVGREAELSTLKSALDDAISGKGSTIFISGEAGIGKTRLVEEFRKRAESLGLRILSGAAMSNSAHPFQIFSNALASITDEPLFEESEHTFFEEIFAVNSAGLLLGKASSEEGGLDADIFASMLSAVQDFVRDSFGHGGEMKSGLGRLEYGDMKILIEHGRNLFLTAVFRGVEHPDMKNSLKLALQRINEKYGSIIEKWSGDTSELAPVQVEISKLACARFLVRKKLEGVRLENERVRIANRALGILQNLSREKPLMIVLEDVHWADESSLFVLPFLARNIGSAPVLILATARLSEGQEALKTLAAMKEEGPLVEIHLAGLDQTRVKAMVDLECPPNDFPASFADRLHRDCAGNPFFITELLKQMLDDGAIAYSDGKYTLASENYSMPSSVGELVDRRLGGLDSSAMTLAEYASCVGRVFPTDVVLGSSSIEASDSSLEKLVAVGIVATNGEIGEFSHALFQAAIYNSMTPWWRASHHKCLGEYIEATHVNRTDEVIYELARHFYNASQHEKALNYCCMAGEKAEQAFSAKLALHYYDKALDAWSKIGDTHCEIERTLLEKLGDVNVALGEYDQALRHYEKALRAIEDDNLAANILRKEGSVYSEKGEYDKSLEVLEKALRLLKEEHTPEFGRIMLAEGGSHWRKGDYEQALPKLLRAIETFELFEDEERDLAKAFCALGNLHWSQGRYPEAKEFYGKGLCVMERQGDKRGVSSILNNLGVVDWNLGELDSAVRYYQRSLALSEKMGDQKDMTAALSNLGIIYKERGEYDKSLECNLKSLEISQRIGDTRGVAWAYNNIGLAHWNDGDVKLALDYYERSLAISTKSGDKRGIAWSLNLMGRLRWNSGETERALECYQKSLEIRESLGDKTSSAIVMNNIGALYSETGEASKARVFFERGLETCKAVGNRKDYSISLCGLAEVRLQQGDAAGALEFAEKALAVAQEVGAKPEIASCRLTLARTLMALGQKGRALAELGKARETFEAVRSKMDLAKIFFEYAVYYKALGAPEKVREALDKSLALFDATGMKLWAEKARKALAEIEQ